MNHLRFVAFVFVGGLAALLAGCGPPKLNVEKDFEVDFFHKQAFGPEILPVEQTVKVTITASVPVEVYCLTGVNEAVAIGYHSEDLRTKAVAAKVGVTSDSINFVVPAKTQGVVIIRTNETKPVTGKIRLTN